MRKRSTYRPRPVLKNPVGYALESVTPLSQHETYLINVKIKNSEAMVALLHGNATLDDMNILIGMTSITEALCHLGVGKDYLEIAIEGRSVIPRIMHRAIKHKRFTPTGPEIQSLNNLMELHDDQMEILTIADMEKALKFIEHGGLKSKQEACSL